jgi:hypothetical protein
MVEEKKNQLHICINSLVSRKLSHDPQFCFFFFGLLRVPTRRCDLVVPADGGWGRSNENMCVNHVTKKLTHHIIVLSTYWSGFTDCTRRADGGLSKIKKRQLLD